MKGLRSSLRGILLALLVGFAPQITVAQDNRREQFTFEIVDFAGAADLVRARAQAINLSAYPIFSLPTHSTYEVFKRGQRLGRDPHVLSKVGDCNSAEWLFLYPFGEGRYELGEYVELQEVIEQFEAAFAFRSYAAHNGLNVLAVQQPLWADPNDCMAGEQPLICEYRLHNPSLAVIMFGTNDMQVLTPEQFDHNLRSIVVKTMQAGIIPVLSTFPRNLAHSERSVQYNQIVVRVALDLNIPLINLWAALEPLPGYGIDDDGYHLNGPITGAGDFSSPANLQTGYPQRNLVTLQALDTLWRSVYQ